MAYGIQISNSDGDVYFDTTKITWNYLASVTQAANTGANYQINAMQHCSEFMTMRFHVNKAPGDQEAYLHNVSVSAASNVLGITTGGTAGKVDTLVVLFGR